MQVNGNRDSKVFLNLGAALLQHVISGSRPKGWAY